VVGDVELEDYMTPNRYAWIYEKAMELSNELQKLSWLMAGCQMGLHESVNPILNYKKTIVESKGKKGMMLSCLSNY